MLSSNISCSIQQTFIKFASWVLGEKDQDQLAWYGSNWLWLESLLALFQQEHHEVPEEKAESVSDEPLEEAKLSSVGTWEILGE